MIKDGTHIHFIGIGGAGLSAIARVLLERGLTVSGSDRSPSALALRLQADGVRVDAGHAAENITGADLVVRSSAVPDENVEVAAALAKGIPVLKRTEFFPLLVAGSRVIAAAGSHGKSTTTSMIALVLHDAGLDPSFIIGGEPADLGANAHAGGGAFFVIEADEYDRMFHGLHAELAVVTNVEHDHPDIFPTAADFTAAFEIFVDQLADGGTLVAWGDSPATRSLLDRAAGAGRKTIAYGFDRENDLRAAAITAVAGQGYAFDVLRGGERLGRIALQVPGRDNVLNALAAAAAGMQAGLEFAMVAGSLERFSGVGRRFQVIGEAAGVIVVDDYGHHPTEIRSTIAAARSRYPGREIWVTWQPHTYSRVQLLCNEFAAAFAEADHVVLTDVFAAREQAPEGFSLGGLVAKMDHPDARLIGDLPAVTGYLTAKLSPGSVLLVLSAGDADRISRDVLDNLRQR